MKLIPLLLTVLVCFSNSYARSEQHFVLVHGGGPSTLVGLRKMRNHLTKLGVPAAQISLPTYDYQDSLSTINQEFKSKLKSILQAHPNTLILTHSLGDFVALRALAELGMEDRVSHFIALGGVANGQDQSPKYCDRIACPPYLRELIPYQGAFTQAIWTAHPSLLRAIKHCAVYSMDDMQVRSPRDAAAFPLSTRVVLKEYSHWDLATDRRALEEALQRCGVDSDRL